jgi:hypothetical protein
MASTFSARIIRAPGERLARSLPLSTRRADWSTASRIRRPSRASPVRRDTGPPTRRVFVFLGFVLRQARLIRARDRLGSSAIRVNAALALSPLAARAAGPVRAGRRFINASVTPAYRMAMRDSRCGRPFADGAGDMGGR